MGARMHEKFDKYWRDFSEIMIVACVLDPRKKFIYVRYIYEKLYDDDGLSRSIEFKEKLYSLYNEYSHLDLQSYSSSSSSKECNDVRLQDNDIWSQDFELYVPSATSMKKSQLDKYLDEPKFDCTKELDILAYWKTNSVRFLAVAAMAKAILAIPISTVSSESAFSTSGNILNDYRSLLGSDIVESLVCWKDWILAEEANEQDSLIGMLEQCSLQDE